MGIHILFIRRENAMEKAQDAREQALTLIQLQRRWNPSAHYSGREVPENRIKRYVPSYLAGGNQQTFLRG
jgi:hypothetical protein